MKTLGHYNEKRDVVVRHHQLWWLNFFSILFICVWSNIGIFFFCSNKSIYKILIMNLDGCRKSKSWKLPQAEYSSWKFFCNLKFFCLQVHFQSFLISIIIIISYCFNGKKILHQTKKNLEYETEEFFPCFQLFFSTQLDIFWTHTHTKKKWCH